MRENVFITGGNSGIGLALAKKYLQNPKVHLGICARDKSKFLSNFTPEEQKKIQFFSLDVTDRQAIKDALAQFIPEGEYLHLMVANAGIGNDKGQPYKNFDLWYKVLNTNIWGVLHAFEAALEKFDPKGGGQLVAISSVAGLVGLPKVASYSASKAAVNALCESMSIDLKAKGIAVTAILPGFIDTPLTKKNRHPMPFLMPADRAADKIFNAIKKKKALFIFPWPMRILITILRYMPRCGYRWLMQYSY